MTSEKGGTWEPGKAWEPAPLIEPKHDEAFLSRNLLLNPVWKTEADVVTLATWSEKWYREVGIEPLINWKNVEKAIDNVQPILNKNTHNATPSIFKRAAALTLAFMEVSPLDQSMAGSRIEDMLTNLNNHQNAIVVFEYCRRCLQGAKLIHSEGKFAGREFILKNKIAVSRHFYRDLIFALGCEGRDSRSFHAYALLYESLAYKSNPGVSYEETV